MKKYLFLLITVLVISTGCTGNKNFDDDVTYTTIYPIEYVTKEIYGKYTNVNSIYPDGVDISKYKLTKKLKEEYANSNTFIYNGLGKEKNITVDFLNINKKLQVIDAMQGMNVNYSDEELWLDPSSYLMLAQNIKNGLIEYNDNFKVKKDINKEYSDFKVKVSELDVELNLLSKNATSTTLIVTDDVFKFLEKYNINVISLDSDNPDIDKAYAEASDAMDSGECKYIFMKKGENLDNHVEDFISTHSAKKLKMDMLNTITHDQRKTGEDYISIMTDNIENIKTELYK